MRNQGADAPRSPGEGRQAGPDPEKPQHPPGEARQAAHQTVRPQRQADQRGAGEQHGLRPRHEMRRQPDRQPGADRAAGSGRRTARPGTGESVGDDGGARRQQQPAGQPQSPRQPAAAPQQHQDQHEPRRQEDIGGEAESADQGAGDPGAGQAEEVVRRGVEWVDAFVEVGRVVADHGRRQQKAEEQQDAGGGVETPGSTIRHGAGTPVAAAVGARKAGAARPFHRRTGVARFSNNGSSRSAVRRNGAHGSPSAGWPAKLARQARHPPRAVGGQMSFVSKDLRIARQPAKGGGRPTGARGRAVRDKAGEP